jgi:hypothetical protein
MIYCGIFLRSINCLNKEKNIEHTNIEHETPNKEQGTDEGADTSSFDIPCSVFDVSFRKHYKIKIIRANPFSPCHPCSIPPSIK